jgi:hypothetical protein
VLEPIVVCEMAGIRAKIARLVGPDATPLLVQWMERSKSILKSRRFSKEETTAVLYELWTACSLVPSSNDVWNTCIQTLLDPRCNPID